jgi:hypothetical protein
MMVMEEDDDGEGLLQHHVATRPLEGTREWLQFEDDEVNIGL